MKQELEGIHMLSDQVQYKLSLVGWALGSGSKGPGFEAHQQMGCYGLGQVTLSPIAPCRSALILAES